MKGKMKKLLSVMLAVIMATSVFAVSASAGWFDDLFGNGGDEFYEYGTAVIDGVCYTLDGETMTASVSYYEIDENGNCTVPSAVTIPETVSSDGKSYTVEAIEYYAFADCPTVKSVTIPASVDYIDDYAFTGASYLEAVIIPQTTEFEYFGAGVFEGTPVLGYLAEKSENGAVILGKNVLYAYVGADSVYTVPEEITIIADYCFFMSGAEEIILNDSISEIRAYTFASCRNLKEITIPDAVESIGEGAFSNCTSLEKVNLGDNLYTIGIRAFENTKVKELYLGDSISYTSGAFAGCNTLEKFVISEENGYYMDGDALCCHYDIEELWGEDIPEDLLEGLAFSFDSLDYYLITSENSTYTLPESISIIGDYAFYNCKQIKKVVLTQNTDIYTNAFANSGIETIDFSKIAVIADCAFRGCKNLKSADLSNIAGIFDSAFENCTALENVTFGNETYYIGSRAFANTALTSVEINGEFCQVYEGAFADCPKLTKLSFLGVEYIDCYVASSCPKLERVYISADVTAIDENAFADNENTVFEIIKYSDGYDFVRDMDYKYEIVGKLSFFERVSRFFTNLYYSIFDWIFRW